eukprot:TRINITY_DN430_c1_g2_i1.p1 TRINITY_DN430_c1_g2~~TRINITY_DN430_c1_g2_i1.p1  ORF type:complete len:1263 (+),score=360.11 TRINITY_DN430_c1_g2_i1:84-3872(+)
MGPRPGLPLTPQRAPNTARTRTPTSRNAGRDATPQSARLHRDRGDSAQRSFSGGLAMKPTSLDSQFADVAERTKTPRKAKATGGGENVVVAVRVRSFLERELKTGGRDADLCIRMKNETTEIKSDRGKNLFSFDHCFWSNDIHDPEVPYSSQEQVYERLGAPVVENALKGFNSSVIAYGQTGSGKSYSIFGRKDSDQAEDEGLIPRVCKELFRRVEAKSEEQPDVTYRITASMIEVYMEKVYDLLNHKNILPIRGDLQRGFAVQGSKRKEVKSYKDINKLLKIGAKEKTIAETQLNKDSSRAHTLFELEIHASTQSVTKISKLSLCDLAGSERQKDAKTVIGGEEFNQACQINKSLLCLGKCVEAVVQKGNGALVTEFRNSALTKLLQDSIGGNSKTVILVAISPSAKDAHTTLQALRFADRAKCIQTHAVINEDAIWESKMNARLIAQIYETKMQALQKEFDLEQQQAEMTQAQLRLEQEAAALQAERETLTKQREDMMRKKELSDSEKAKIAARESALAKKLQQVQNEFAQIQDKASELEAKLYSENQNAKKEREDIENELDILQGKHDLLQRQYDEDVSGLKQELEESKKVHTIAMDQLQSAHLAAMEKKEKKYTEERKSYVLEMMNAITKIKKECQGKEEKWRSEKSNYKKQIEDLEQQLRTSKQGADRLAEQNTELREKAEDLDRKLSDGNFQISKLNSTKISEIETLQDQLNAANWGREEATNKITQLYEDLGDANGKLQLLEEEVNEAKLHLRGEIPGLVNPEQHTVSQLASLMMEIRRGEKSKQEDLSVKSKLLQQKQAMKLESLASKHIEDITAMKAHHKTALDTTASAHSEEIAALKEMHEAEVKKLREFQTEVDSDISTLRSESSQKSRQLQSLQDELELATSNNSLLEKRIASMKNQLEVEENASDALKKEIRELKAGQASEIDELLREKRNSREDARRILEDEKQAMVIEIEEERKATQRRHDQEIEELKQHEVERVTAIRREMENRLDESAAERTRLVNETISLRHKNQLQEEKVEALQREKRHTDRSHQDEIEIEGLRARKEIESLTSLNKELQTQLDHHAQVSRGEATSLQKKLEEQEIELDQVILRNKELTSQLEVREQSGREEIQNLTRRLKEQEEEIKNSRDDNNALSRKLKEQAVKNEEDVRIERQKRKFLQDELQKARAKESNSMQHLLSMFQKTQDEFQSQLQGEADQAKTVMEQSVSVSPTSSPVFRPQSSNLQGRGGKRFSVSPAPLHLDKENVQSPF